MTEEPETPELEDLAARLTDLEQVVAALDAGADPETGEVVEGEPNWTQTWAAAAGGDDSEAFMQRWRELGEWVHWLDDAILRHLNRVYLPSCWWRHPPAVEQLTALMLAHRAALANPDSFDLIHWFMTEGLWGTLHQLESENVFGACKKAGHHEEGRSRRPFEIDDDYLNEAQRRLSP